MQCNFFNVRGIVLEKYNIFNLQKRLLVFLVLITFIFTILASRLAYIQTVKSKEYLSFAQSQWERDLPIKAKRGIIYDRNGVELAVS